MHQNVIRESFAGRLMISYFHCIESYLIPRIIDDQHAVKRYYKKKSGKDINLENPTLFSEKTNWYKLNDRNPLMQQCADKYAVREYVNDCGFGDSLNELYGVYDNVNDIKLEGLPNKFVLKAAHGTHMNIIWPDTDLKWWQVKMLASSWLKQDIYWGGREWVYKDMPRRIIVEKYLEDETGELRDYKFYCYNGLPKLLQFDVGRFKGTHYRNFYDMDLHLLDITDDSTIVNSDLIPVDIDNYKRMQEMAAILAKPFQFVRVDLYFVGGKIYFGELTFFDGGGWSGFEKEEYERIFGDPWVIKK